MQPRTNSIVSITWWIKTSPIPWSPSTGEWFLSISSTSWKSSSLLSVTGALLNSIGSYFLCLRWQQMWMHGMQQSISGREMKVLYTRMSEISCCLSKNKYIWLFVFAKPVRPITSPITKVIMEGEVAMLGWVPLSAEITSGNFVASRYESTGYHHLM